MFPTTRVAFRFSTTSQYVVSTTFSIPLLLFRFPPSAFRLPLSAFPGAVDVLHGDVGTPSLPCLTDYDQVGNRIANRTANRVGVSRGRSRNHRGLRIARRLSFPPEASDPFQAGERRGRQKGSSSSSPPPRTLTHASAAAPPHQLRRPRGWNLPIPVGRFWRAALVVFFNDGLDSGVLIADWGLRIADSEGGHCDSQSAIRNPNSAIPNARPLGRRHHISPLRSPSSAGVQGDHDAPAAHRLLGPGERLRWRMSVLSAALRGCIVNRG